MARQGSAGGAINYGSCRVLRLLRRAGLGFIILTPGTGNWGSLGSLWGHHAQGHEPCFFSLQPSLLLDVLSHPEGPATPCRAGRMSTAFPKEWRWIEGGQAAPGITSLPMAEKILAVPLKQHKSWLGQRPKSKGMVI